VSTDLFFSTDPELAPRPRKEIEITEVSVTPVEGSSRVRIDMSTTPFAPQDRPNIELTVFNPAGLVVGSASIIEAANRKMRLIMHLREKTPAEGSYLFIAQLYYEQDVVQHTLEIPVTLVTG
jgi:hypothetical protein